MSQLPDKGSPKTISDSIYAALKEQILSGAIPPSTVLSQNELARQYNVSRSPVRDALRLLEQERLVQLVPKVGALVKADDYTDAIEVTEIRCVLEGYVAKKLAHSATYEDVCTLREHLDRVGQAVEANDLDAFYELERSYHDRMLSLAGNQRLYQMVANAVDPLCSRAYLNYVKRSPAAAQAMYRDHLGILQAIENGDGEKAEALMRKHIERMHAAMLQMAGYQKE